MIDDHLDRLERDRSTAPASELQAIVHVVRPLAADLLATACFYAGFAASGDVSVATILASGVGVTQLGWVLARGRRVPPIQWASLLLVLVVGAISLVTRDARYVLYKAGIIYLVIGATMLRRGWLMRYVPPIATGYLSDAILALFGYQWAALIIGTGLLDLVLVWREPARTVALVMGIWAPTSKLMLLVVQYLIGRGIVRRRIRTAIETRIVGLATGRS